MRASSGRVILIGLGVALSIFFLDRLSKWWLIDVFDISARGEVELGPYFKLVLFWNRGISFGLLQGGDTWRWVLAAISLFVGAVLVYWLSRAPRPYTGLALGLLIGGAIGNVYDRVVHGAVADFFYPHWGEHYFPAFNVADAAINIGVALILFEALFMPRDDEAEALMDTDEDEAPLEPFEAEAPSDTEEP